METQEEIIENPESISLAYETSMKTYDWALKRIDAWDGNLDKVLVWGGPFTLALIGGIARTQLPMGHECTVSSILFWSLMLAALILSGCAIQSGLKGKRSKIQFVSPQYLWDNWVHFSKEDYQYNAIKYAGIHFDTNTKLVEVKSEAARKSVTLFILSTAVAIVAWLSVSF